MNEYKEGLARKLVEFFRSIGIDPLYGVTVIVCLVVISYRKDIQRWEELSFWHKGLIISAFIGAAVLTIFSLLQLTGLIDM